MKSKTSFFNRTVFKKNMTLYWPIWVCYLLYGMVKVPGQLWSRLQQQTDMTAYARDYALYNSLRLEVDVAAIAIMAVVCGMALFGYLFTQKNAYMIHALPVTRGELYVTNMISGLCAVSGIVVFKCYGNCFFPLCNGVFLCHVYRTAVCTSGVLSGS